MQSKNLWIGIGVLIAVVLIGGYLLVGRGKTSNLQTPTPTPKAQALDSQTPAFEVSGEIQEIQVEGNEYSFTPKSLTLAKGDKVMLTFNNTGRLPHNFTIDELGVATKTISGGETDSIEFTVTKSGTFESYCGVGGHRSLGMEGEVKVE